MCAIMSSLSLLVTVKDHCFFENTSFVPYFEASLLMWLLKFHSPSKIASLVFDNGLISQGLDRQYVSGEIFILVLTPTEDTLIEGNLLHTVNQSAFFDLERELPKYIAYSQIVFSWIRSYTMHMRLWAYTKCFALFWYLLMIFFSGWQHCAFHE